MFSYQAISMAFLKTVTLCEFNMEDTRNINNKYKGWLEDLIREDVSKKAFPYAVMMEHIDGDFNIGTMVRNANAFGAKEVFYLGKRKWDKRGAVGTYNYTNISYLESMDDVAALAERYVLVGIDNVPGSVPVKDFQWAENTLMVFGEEGRGLSPEILKLCSAIVEIPMHGSVRSLNVGTASGVVMFDYVNKLKIGT